MRRLPLCSYRLSVIDESSFLSHSDISYDRTDDDMVLRCFSLPLEVQTDMRCGKDEMKMFPEDTESIIAQ